MKRFRDILVYPELDHPGCLAQVMDLARRHGAAVTLCEVIEPPPGTQDSSGIVERIDGLRRSRASRSLRQVAADYADQMIDYSVLVGTPFLAIIEYVLQQDFDLVVHISERSRTQEGAGLNADGMHLIRKCPCAVWALHPSAESDSRDVLLALDREVARETTGAEAFALTLAESAISLAVALDGSLQVLHCWRPYGHDLFDDPELALPAEELAAFRNQQREDNEQWFRRLTQRIQSIAPQELVIGTRLVEGDPLQVVQAHIADRAVGSLVLGTVGTSANPGVLIGTTAESILARCAASVLALKPAGFVSPMDLAARTPRASRY